MAVYENYGDTNFFDGGCFIMDCGDGDYEYITCDFVFDADGDTYLFATGLLDPTDSWIDLDTVKDCCGAEGDLDGAELVRAILSYYGAANCGGEEQMLSSVEVQENMNGYASEYEFETDTWSTGPSH